MNFILQTLIKLKFVLVHCHEDQKIDGTSQWNPEQLKKREYTRYEMFT